MSHDRELVVHSFEVIRVADDVLIGSLDAETGQRGFVITGNPAFLAPFAQATEAIPTALKQLMSLVGDNAQQLALIYALKETTDSKLEELKSTVATENAKDSRRRRRWLPSAKARRPWIAFERLPGRSHSPKSNCSRLDR